MDRSQTRAVAAGPVGDGKQARAAANTPSSDNWMGLQGYDDDDNAKMAWMDFGPVSIPKPSPQSILKTSTGVESNQREREPRGQRDRPVVAMLPLYKDGDGNWGIGVANECGDGDQDCSRPCVVVRALMPDGPGVEAGLCAGDQIIAAHTPNNDSNGETHQFLSASGFTSYAQHHNTSMLLQVQYIEKQQRYVAFDDNIDVNEISRANRSTDYNPLETSTIMFATRLTRALSWWYRERSVKSAGEWGIWFSNLADTVIQECDAEAIAEADAAIAADAADADCSADSSSAHDTESNCSAGSALSSSGSAAGPVVAQLAAGVSELVARFQRRINSTGESCEGGPATAHSGGGGGGISVKDLISQIELNLELPELGRNTKETITGLEDHTGYEESNGFLDTMLPAASGAETSDIGEVSLISSDSDALDSDAPEDAAEETGKHKERGDAQDQGDHAAKKHKPNDCTLKLRGGGGGRSCELSAGARKLKRVLAQLHTGNCTPFDLTGPLRADKVEELNTLPRRFPGTPVPRITVQFGPANAHARKTEAYYCPPRVVLPGSAPGTAQCWQSAMKTATADLKLAATKPMVCSVLQAATIGELRGALTDDWGLPDAPAVPGKKGKMRSLRNYLQELLSSLGMFLIRGKVRHKGKMVPHWFTYDGFRGILADGMKYAAVVQAGDWETAKGAGKVFKDAGLVVETIYVLVRRT